jgi:NADH-quinone oxidoreductase subunit M
VGIVYGSLVAWRARTMRMLVAYSSLAHLGFVMLGIVAFDVMAAQGAVLQMVNHGIIVAAAFIIVGVINRGTGEEDIDRIGGLAARAPWLSGIFLIVAMASLAVPGSNAFVGEFFILAGVFRHHAWLAVLACIGIVYAAVYMLRLYQSSMNHEERGIPAGRRQELGLPDLVALVPLVLIMLFIALWPASIVGGTRASVEAAVAPAQVAAGRPADQILVPVPRNPPAENLPLPGDETAADPATTTPGGQP